MKAFLISLLACFTQNAHAAEPIVKVLEVHSTVPSHALVSINESGAGIDISPAVHMPQTRSLRSEIDVKFRVQVAAGYRIGLMPIRVQWSATLRSGTYKLKGQTALFTARSPQITRTVFKTESASTQITPGGEGIIWSPCGATEVPGWINLEVQEQVGLDSGARFDVTSIGSTSPGTILFVTERCD